MDRQIARVVTAGTATDPALLDDRASRYLAAVAVATARSRQTPGVGIAYADVSTGEFRACQLERTRRRCWTPSESWRVSGRLEASGPRTDGREARRGRADPRRECQITTLDSWRFEAETAVEALLGSRTSPHWTRLGCRGCRSAARAAGALVGYVADTLRFGGIALGPLRVYEPGRHVFLDANAVRTLELFEGGATRSIQGSLLWVLDQTVTPMGARLIRQWLGQPLVDVAAIARGRITSPRRCVSRSSGRQ